MQPLNILTFILVFAGGLIWGLGAFNFDRAATAFGGGSILPRMVYTLVGVLALYQVVTTRHQFEALAN